jgi:hypothetical protein
MGRRRGARRCEVRAPIPLQIPLQIPFQIPLQGVARPGLETSERGQLRLAVWGLVCARIRMLACAAPQALRPGEAAARRPCAAAAPTRTTTRTTRT